MMKAAMSGGLDLRICRISCCWLWLVGERSVAMSCCSAFWCICGAACCCGGTTDRCCCKTVLNYLLCIKELKTSGAYYPAYT